MQISTSAILVAVLAAMACTSNRPDPVRIPKIQQIYDKDWYSGYLDMDQLHAHYFFFPSQNDPPKDPVLFWFNGGPGCSSLLGAMYEHGPFIFNDAFAQLQ